VFPSPFNCGTGVLRELPAFEQKNLIKIVRHMMASMRNEFTIDD
jgi:hypothetical protein